MEGGGVLWCEVGVGRGGELLRRGRKVDNTLAQFVERDANFITW